MCLKVDIISSTVSEQIAEFDLFTITFFTRVIHSLPKFFLWNIVTFYGMFSSQYIFDKWSMIFGSLNKAGTCWSSLQMTLYIGFFHEGSVSLHCWIATKNSFKLFKITLTNSPGTCKTIHD